MFSAFCYEGWSAPSAIGIAGLGGGFEIGLEVSFYLTPDSLKEQPISLIQVQIMFLAKLCKNKPKSWEGNFFITLKVLFGSLV